MKGFVRVFEAIVASIILIASLTFFFPDSSPPSGWDSTSLEIMAQDAIQSAYLNGTITRFVKTGDKDSLNAYFTQMLPKTVDFSITVRGIPNDIIRVACVDCSAGDLSEMQTILAPVDFNYNSRNISIRTEALAWTLNDLNEETDVLFFFDSTRVILYQSKIRNFLDSGGSVVLLSDIPNQNNLTTPIATIFNLTWQSGSSGSPGTFYDIYNSRNNSHYIAKYFASVNGTYPENIASRQFTVFHSSNINLSRDMRDAIQDNGLKFAFARAVSGAYNNHGRAVWINDYTRLNHGLAATKGTDQLVKAAVMWASGESYSMDDLPKQPPPVNFKSSILVYDGDLYIFELRIWRAFF